MLTSAVALSLLLTAGRASPPIADVLGEVRQHVVKPDESLIEIARDYDLGFGEIAAANPGVDEYVPDEGSTVVIPTIFIVPRAAAPGEITVNLSEMRLYLLPTKAGAAVVTFPFGTADDEDGFETPLGSFQVVQKEVNPSWYPPPSVRQERPEIPAVVPPGEDNPMGTHALKLSAPSILIHGTNKPYGVGRKVSRGCIRLYPEDVVKLYPIVPIGTTVTIVREPVKVGTRDGRVFVEVHDDAAAPASAEDALALLKKRRLLGRTDEDKVRAAVAAKLGLPVDVTR